MYVKRDIGEQRILWDPRKNAIQVSILPRQRFKKNNLDNDPDQ